MEVDTPPVPASRRRAEQRPTPAAGGGAGPRSPAPRGQSPLPVGLRAPGAGRPPLSQSHSVPRSWQHIIPVSQSSEAQRGCSFSQVTAPSSPLPPARGDARCEGNGLGGGSPQSLLPPKQTDCESQMGRSHPGAQVRPGKITWARGTGRTTGPNRSGVVRGSPRGSPAGCQPRPGWMWVAAVRRLRGWRSVCGHQAGLGRGLQSRAGGAPRARPRCTRL